MGLFGLFKRKNRDKNEVSTNSVAQENLGAESEELSVPEFDNSFSFEKQDKKKAAEPVVSGKPAKKKAAKTVRKAKVATAEDNTAPVKAKSASQTKAVKSAESKKSADKPEELSMQEISLEELDIPSDDRASQRTGKFEIKKTKDSRYVFNLYASNHVIVATSQVYSSVQSALNGIRSVIANSSRAEIEDQTVKGYKSLPYPKWEIYLDNAKQYRFRLSASNGSCVCHSQGYTKKSNCKSGIESIQKFAPTARIDKAYIKKEETK